MNEQKDFFLGMFYAFLAIVSWGLMPIYWYFLEIFPATLIFVCRTIFAALSLCVILLLIGKIRVLLEIFLQPKTLVYLVIAAFFISINWLGYIKTVQDHRVMEASLGYYLCPLLTIALGMIIFKERLGKMQLLACFLAACAVAYQAYFLATFPWYALILAGSFAAYSAVKKMTKLDGLLSLTVETLVITPFALMYIFGAKLHTFLLQASMNHLLLLIGSGLITALPLIWFTNAAKRLPLSLLGFLNYFAPTIQLSLAVFYFSEPFTSVHKVSFLMIGCALIIYMYDLFYLQKNKSKQ